jgi:hypothetical protein
MDWMPKNIRSEASDWWQDVQQNHSLELQQRIHQYLSAAKEAESGCLELGSEECPARIQWRGRRMRVYQLVAWGSAQAVPLPNSVVRHLCNNRSCINPKHLQTGTQTHNLHDQRQARAARLAISWTHS